jgi:hypothetical protein
MTGDLLRRRNAQPAPLADVPLHDGPWFRRTILDSVKQGARIASLFGRENDGAIELVVVLAKDASGELGLARTRLSEESFPSIVADCPQAQLFERRSPSNTAFNRLDIPGSSRSAFNTHRLA